MVEISVITATCDHCGKSIELAPLDFPEQYGWYYGWYISYDWTTCTCPECNRKQGVFDNLDKLEAIGKPMDSTVNEQEHEDPDSYWLRMIELRDKGCGIQ